MTSVRKPAGIEMDEASVETLRKKNRIAAQRHRRVLKLHERELSNRMRDSTAGKQELLQQLKQYRVEHEMLKRVAAARFL
jgi:uncharacterized protein with WD repeat